jgi:hypothetical protein
MAPPDGQFQSARAYIYAFPNQGDYSSDQDVLIYSESLDQSTGPVPFTFHYPTGHPRITDFIVTSYAYPESELTYYSTVYGSLPDRIKTIDAGIVNHTVHLPGYVAADITGSADIQTCYVRMNQEAARLTFYARGPAGRALRLPPIPNDFRQEFNIPLVVEANMYLSDYSLRDYNDKSGYQEIARSWSGLEVNEDFISSGTEVLDVSQYKMYNPALKSSRQNPDPLAFPRIDLDGR